MNWRECFNYTDRRHRSIDTTACVVTDLLVPRPQVYGGKSDGPLPSFFDNHEEFEFIEIKRINFVLLIPLLPQSIFWLVNSKLWKAFIRRLHRLLVPALYKRVSCRKSLVNILYAAPPNFLKNKIWTLAKKFLVKTLVKLFVSAGISTKDLFQSLDSLHFSVSIFSSKKFQLETMQLFDS